MAGKISGFAVAYTAFGGLLIYSGIKGTSLTATLTDLAKGKLDSTKEASATAPEPAEEAPGSGASAYTLASLQELWTSNGGDSSTSYIAANVGYAESGGNPKATSPNPDGGTNVGIWQLDTPGGVGSGYTIAELQNPNTNAAITVMATNNGTDWSQWADSVVVDGQYVGPTAPAPATSETEAEKVAGQL